MEPSNLESNLELLVEILKNPAVTHIEMRREDDSLVDIPIAHADQTIRRQTSWIVVGGNYPQVELQILGEELPVTEQLPLKPSEEKPKKTRKPRTPKK